MWKITTRGFKLEEVLIMAAMNLLTSADTAELGAPPLVESPLRSSSSQCMRYGRASLWANTE